jgi:hypothetical protein
LDRDPTSPERIDGPRRAKAASWPFGFLIALALVAVMESVIKRGQVSYDQSSAWDWLHARARNTVKSKGCEVLIFGDSTAKTGLLPRVIAGQTGLRSYNLALIGGQAPSSYFSLRQALRAGARPKLIVMSNLPTMLARPFTFNERQWPELLDPLEGLLLASDVRDPIFYARFLVQWLFPSVRARLDVRLAISNALQCKTRPPENEPFRRSWKTNLGSVIFPVEYTYRGDARGWSQGNYPGPWRCEAINALYLHRFIELAAQHGITVVWLLYPLEPESQTLMELGGQSARFEWFVRDQVGRHRNLVVLDGTRAGLRRAEFSDQTHPNREGARVVSARLAAALNHLASGESPRGWITLPAAEKRRRDVPIEDVAQAFFALERAAKVRR